MSKCSKVHLDFKTAEKNSEKVLWFWDNCIWIDIVKLYLWRTGSFSLAANVLLGSPKIWHVKNRDIFYSVDLAVINGYDQDNVIQISTVPLDVKNAARNWEKKNCFRDKCIWNAVIKLSPLSRGFFSSAANVSTSSPKIWHVNNRDVFQLNWPRGAQSIRERFCHADFHSGSARLPCCLSKGPLKRDFLDIYLTTFS